MDCYEVRESLEAYAAGELEAEAAGRIERHLDACLDCSLQRDSLSVLIADLRHAGGAVRPLQPFALPRPERAAARRRGAKLAWSFAAVAGAWAVFMSVLVLVPSASERVSVFPIGRSLHDARAAAQSASADSARLASANVLLRQKVTAAQLGVPVGAVIAAERFLATDGAKAVGAQAGEKLTWALVADASRPSKPLTPPAIASLRTVHLRGVTKVPQASGGVALHMRLSRTPSGAWVVVEAKL